MAINPQIVEALKRLNPSVPADEDLYVDRDGIEGARGWDLPERLEALVTAGIRTTALLHGAIGVGKTTELQRWEQRLGESSLVALVTLNGVDLRELSIEYVASRETYGPDRAIRRLLAAACSRWGAASGVDVIEDMNPAEEQVDLAHLVEQVRGPARRSLILLVDGVDLLLPESAKLAVERIFAATRSLVDAVVCVVPHVTLAMDTSFARALNVDQIWHLPAFPVHNADEVRNRVVVDLLADGLGRRLAGLDLFDQPDYCLKEAAWHSGGVLRDAVRILHASVLSAARLGRVNRFHLSQGLREIRQDLAQGMTPENWRELRSFDANPTRQVPSELIARNAILAYESLQDRYWHPHPLLASMLADPQLGSSRVP